MNNALVMMKAMPFTTGHEDILRFASGITTQLTVFVDTHPDEPFVEERLGAIQSFLDTLPCEKVTLHHEVVIPQKEEDCEDFWGMWKGILSKFEFDVVVCSEPYGKTLADMFEVEFFIYDPSREMNTVKATRIRENPIEGFSLLSPHMQKALRTRVTLFGAESNGKTTLTKDIAEVLEAPFIHEYARPYLEFMGPEINFDSMRNIFIGQSALQESYINKNSDSPWLIQDTDLFSTTGYWRQPHWEASLGPVPEIMDEVAQDYKADLYIIPRSNIPFEEDVIRYGGDKRESSDEYWIGIAEREGLNYIVLDSETRSGRLDEALKAVLEFTLERLAPLKYDRRNA